MNKNQFFNRNSHLNVDKSEIERKWRVYQEEQEFLMMAEAARQGRGQAIIPSPGGGSGIINNQQISDFFDVTADWSLTVPQVSDEITFRSFLENGFVDGDVPVNLLNVDISNFVFTDLGNGYQRIQCNLTADANPEPYSENGYEFQLNYIDMSEIKGIGRINGLQLLSLNGNILENFDIPLPYGLKILYLYGNSNLQLNVTENNLPQSLETLSISGILINDSNLEATLASIPDGLLYLYMEENQLTEFVTAATFPSSLLDLSLAYGQISNFNPGSALPNSLQYLNLENNEITSFNPDIPLPSSLADILLHRNQINEFDPDLTLPSGLEYLGLIGNQITNFDPTNELPSGLLELDLRENQISDFNPSNGLPDGLSILYLTQNQISDFDFSLPSNLTYLDLGSNQIGSFSSSLPVNMGYLGLSYNILTIFDVQLPSSLYTLDLSSNLMTDSSYTSMETWASNLPSPDNVGSSVAYFGFNPDPIEGTNLKTIMESKGWTVI